MPLLNNVCQLRNTHPVSIHTCEHTGGMNIIFTASSEVNLCQSLLDYGFPIPYVKKMLKGGTPQWSITKRELH